MPIVKKLVPVDGRMGVVLDVPATDTGSVNILTDEEIEAIRQAEREACAKIADQFAAVTAALDGGAERSSIAAGMTNIAAAIRARSISSN